MFTYIIRLILLVTLLSGCGPMIHIPSDVLDQSENLRAKIIPGQTSRHEVHARIGQPFISSKGMGVEVYRVASGREAVVEFALVPFWVDSEEVILYALVIYDDNDTVKAISWDVFEHVSDGIHGTAYRGAKLQADGFVFVAVKEGAGKYRKEFLLAPAHISHDTMLLSPPEQKCVLLFFYLEASHWLTYFLDDEEIGAMPLVEIYDWSPDLDLMQVFTKVIVAEGEHELSLTTSWRPREFRRKFYCKPGSVLYAYPELEMVASEPWGFWGWKTKYQGVIAIDNQPSKEYEGWKRLLFYNGKWLGDD